MYIIRTWAKRVQTHGAPTAMDVPPGPRRRHHLSFWRICGRSLSVCSTPGRWMFGMRSAPGQKSPGRYMKGVGELSLKVDGRVLVAFQSNFVGKNEQEWSIVILGIWDPQSSLVPPPAQQGSLWLEMEIEPSLRVELPFSRLLIDLVAPWHKRQPELVVG